MGTKPDQISGQEVAIYGFMSEGREWHTIREIAKHTGAARRTVDEHLRRWARFGMAEMAAVYPGYRYRLNVELGEEAQEYVGRLQQTAKILAEMG